jgi:hypothetical protein
MSLSRRDGLLGEYRPALAIWSLVVLAEALVVVAYVQFTGATVLEPQYLVYPFVWLNVAGGAVVRRYREPKPGNGRARVLAGLVAVGYVVVLLSIDGTITLSGAGSGLSTYWQLPPGWAPLVLIDGGAVRIAIVPFKVLGYFGLGYLLYAAALETVSNTLSGLLGLVSCVGCTAPVAATVVASIFGGATGASISAATAWAYDLSTLVFVLAVAILYFRPLSR